MALKKKSDQVNDEHQRVQVSDFIPYACHYDAHTLLTKNGELMQIIKVTGFASEAVGKKKIKLRDAVRQAIYDSLPDGDYAIWFHTIRRKTNLDPGGDFEEGSFPEYLNRRWAGQHAWDEKYTNELYISIAHDSQGVGITHPNDYLRALWPPAHKKYRMDFLQDVHHELNQAVEKMLHTLSLFGAKRLSVVEKEDGFHSEQLEFLGKIINLEKTEAYAPPIDLSDHISSKHVAFGFNTLEVRGEKKKHFGTILTIKEYREVTTQALDIFLQMPREFIVSQCIDFINAETVKGIYDYHDYIFRLSEDEDLARISGLNDILQSDQGRAIDYGEHQLSVLLIEDSITELEKSVEEATSRLGQLGIVTMREDIRMEECYWSMLPGNFEFISRLKPINTSRAAGFASLHNFPAGQVQGNHWGPAVTIFYTAAQTPYFFNFHSGDHGHTAIIGPYGAGKTVLLNFLCSEAQKFKPRLFFFDKERGSEVFIRGLGGNYHMMILDAKSGQLKLNPLLLNDGTDAQSFIKDWLITLALGVGYQPTEEDINALQQTLPSLMGASAEQKRLHHIADALQKANAPRFSQAIGHWYGNGKFAYLFDHEEDNLDLENGVHGFEMGNAIREKGPMEPLVFYLLQRITGLLDGRPSMIVLDEAWEMLDNPMLAPKILPWLNQWREKNALAIFATESVEEATQSSISADIMAQMATEVYLPNRKAGDAYQSVFELNDKEFQLLKRMKPEKRHFLLKHGPDSVVAQLNLSGMDDLLCVLAGTPERMEVFEQTTKQYGHQPSQWLEPYRQACNDLAMNMEKERERKQKEEMEKAKAAAEAAAKVKEQREKEEEEIAAQSPVPPPIVAEEQDGEDA